MSKLEDVIDEIETYLNGCKPKTFATNQIVVEKGQMEIYLDELRAKLPNEIKVYQKICSQKESILQEAQETHDQMIAEAQEKIRYMIEHHDIVAQATEIANQIVADAQRQADEVISAANNDADVIRSGAIAYTDGLLANLENMISSTLENSTQKFNQFSAVLASSQKQIRANRNELNAQDGE